MLFSFSFRETQKISQRRGAVGVAASAVDVAFSEDILDNFVDKIVNNMGDIIVGSISCTDSGGSE